MHDHAIIAVDMSGFHLHYVAHTEEPYPKKNHAGSYYVDFPLLTFLCHILLAAVTADGKLWHKNTKTRFKRKVFLPFLQQLALLLYHRW